jgi:Flp pilus assembly protein TadG
MTGEVQNRFRALVKRPLAWIAARRIVREQDGATTVEFAMVAAPFLAMIFAIMETAIVFFAGQALETAGADSARLIMTGQAQTQGFDQAKFKNAVCGKIYALFNCSGGLHVDVKSYPSFASVNTAKPLDSNGNLQTGSFGYQPGGPGDIVVVRLMYQWPVYVSLLGLNLADSAGSKRLLMSTVAFRNEPYGG